MEDNIVKLNSKVSTPAANRVSQGAAKPIWFTSLDINDADEPFLPPVHQEAFRQWINETSETTFIQTGGFSLFSVNGDQIDDTPIPMDLELDIVACEKMLKQAQQQAVMSKSAAQIECDFMQAVAVPIFRREEKKLLAIFTYVGPLDTGMGAAAVEASALHYRSCFYRTFEGLFAHDLILQHDRSEKEAKRRDALFLSARRLYNGIDVASVLTEMLYSLEQLYPNAEIHLFLSQDHLNGDPRVKPLLLKSTEHDIVSKAFMENTEMTEKDNHDCIRIAVPMAGKQAVYGVLCMMIDLERWDESNMPAFVMLADTAGSAFENAKLYEQSNLLINELRLINELTKRLNQSLRLKEIYQFAASELLTIFNADYCCMLSLTKTKDKFVVMSSNYPPFDNDSFSIDFGFCGLIHRTKEPLIISDYWNTRVVTSRLMDDTGSRSLIAVPILVNGEMQGVILLTHRAANFFSYENYKLLQVMSTHIGLAVTNASLLSEVRRMVITDNLTGLHARHYLNEQIQSKQKRDTFGSLILVDIDHFKDINDTYGHLVGDQILIQVSKIISAAIRTGDIAARWGGEEIAIYLPNIHKEHAKRVAERIREKVEEDTNPVVTVSCGVSEWTMESEKISVETLFYHADMALYDAKNNGRNRVAIG